MKKTILTLSLLSATLLFSAESTYTQFLDTALQDTLEIHDYSKKHISQLLQNSMELQKYTNKVDAYETEVNTFLQEQPQTAFNSKEEAQTALNTLEKLSTQNVLLAKTVAYLASHQADNANQSYNNTLQTTSKTILRLSDDIGVMADRILLMAKEIGIMADRIVKTQEIQSQNLIATEKLAHYAMALTDKQISQSRAAIMESNQMQYNNNMSSMNNAQMQQSQVAIPMH